MRGRTHTVLPFFWPSRLGLLPRTADGAAVEGPLAVHDGGLSCLQLKRSLVLGRIARTEHHLNGVGTPAALVLPCATVLPPRGGPRARLPSPETLQWPLTGWTRGPRVARPAWWRRCGLRRWWRRRLGRPRRRLSHLGCGRWRDGLRGDRFRDGRRRFGRLRLCGDLGLCRHLGLRLHLFRRTVRRYRRFRGRSRDCNRCHGRRSPIVEHTELPRSE